MRIFTKLLVFLFIVYASIMVFLMVGNQNMLLNQVSAYGTIFWFIMLIITIIVNKNNLS